MQMEQLSSDLLGLVLLKTLLLNTSTNEHYQMYTIYVALTSVSRAWRQTIIRQPWYHATPVQPVIPPDSDGRPKLSYIVK